MINFITFVIILILFAILFRDVSQPPSANGAGGGMRAYRRPGSQYGEEYAYWK